MSIPSAVPAAVKELVARFRRNLEAYENGHYNETQVRREFVDPLFVALGWDVDNRQGYAEAYKDVVHEDSLQVGDSTRAPDYSFRIGGSRKFFVEAKKPAVFIKGDPGPAYQLRRYAWSAKLPLSVLTDFQEFAIYDCRTRPISKDGAAVARVLYCTFDEYEERWPEIDSILSKQAVLSGSFDRFADSTKAKKGTAEVDEAFLSEIEAWRVQLAKNLALRNPRLAQSDLNFAVQRIIDRLIFLRIGEDRGVEDYGRLRRLLEEKHIYRRLQDYFQDADDKYNSGLFHFHAEPARFETPDELTPHLKIDDQVLGRIIRSLYYPDSPYEFSVLPTEILGHVYEQFLGKVIRLTPSHAAKIEDKPEVKKAGGVYYTPDYIVDYIVRNTVGGLVEKRTPKEVSRLRILDPACGSGSFLLGAYTFLLDWHRAWYEQHEPEKSPTALVKDSSNAWRLTTAEKKRILLNNIYGVDVDDQAVEVTKLSLLLKVLEGESRDSLARQRQLFHRQRALPDLGQNIKCGNALVGPDYLKGDLFPDEEEKRRVNPFDWSAEFAAVPGGFDVVLGNPPYVNAWELWEAMPSMRTYVNRGDLYKTAERHWDLYVLFLEKALSLAKAGGLVSFIIPFSYAIQKYGMASRRSLLTSWTLESVADLRTVRVFRKVPIITIIPVIRKAKAQRAHEILINRPGPLSTPTRARGLSKSHTVRQDALLSQHEHMLRLDLTPEAERIVAKLRRRSLPLDQLCYVNYGAQMSSKDRGGFGRDHVLRDSKVNAHCRPTIGGRELYRYRIMWSGRFVDYSLASKMYGPRWPEFFELPKVMIRDITGTHRIESTYDDTGFYCDHSILCALRWCDVAKWKPAEHSGANALSEQYSTRFIAGAVGSATVSFLYNIVLTGEGVRTGGAFHTYPETIRLFPIPRIEKFAPGSLRRFETLVDTLCTLGRKLATPLSDPERTRLTRSFQAADDEIDDILASFYDLTSAEAKYVVSWRPVHLATADDGAEAAVGENA